MSKSQKRKVREALRPEYNLSELKNGVRGKYAARYADRTNLALLAPDVAEHFPNDRAVNSALRLLIRKAKGPAVPNNATAPVFFQGWNSLLCTTHSPREFWTPRRQ